MNFELSRKEIVGQIQRQFDLLGHYGDGTYVPALEGQNVKLITEEAQDLVLIPCPGETQESYEPLEGLTVGTLIYEGEIHFKIQMDSSYREIFLPFIADILVSIPGSGVISEFNSTLEDWRELWAGKRGKLTLHQQRGLIGELIVLDHLLAFKLEAVGSWGGPLRELHDFTSDSIHIEVKTTNRQPPSVRISDISQVAPFMGDARLALIIVGLDRGEDFSLPSKINSIREKLVGSSNLSHFEKVLRRAGYRDEHETAYTYQYSNSFKELHWINDTSPLLDPQKLGDITSTVRDISYTLDVFAMPTEEILDESWSEFANLLAEK